jgi:D-galactarolactone cycloisomerase
MLRAKVDIIQPNITSAGGYTQGAKIASLAEALNKPISGHNTEPTLMTAAQVHTWVSWPMCNLPQEYYGEPSHPIRDEVKAVIFDDLRIEGGFAYPSTTPGIGVTIDEAALRRHSVSLTA